MQPVTTRTQTTLALPCTLLKMVPAPLISRPACPEQYTGYFKELWPLAPPAILLCCTHHGMCGVAETMTCSFVQAEEARFRAQLQELEQQRLGVIEAAWRAREAQRQSEIAAMKAKYVALETQTRELLTAAQDRERALLAAEAELRLRKAELERAAAARMTEAEAAVRRLQVRYMRSLIGASRHCPRPSNFRLSTTAYHWCTLVLDPLVTVSTFLHSSLYS